MSPSRGVDLSAPPDQVWQALIRPELFVQWFGAELDLDPTPGGRFELHMSDGSVKTGVVEVADEPVYLVLRHHPFERDPGGNVRQTAGGYVRFVLREIDGGTRLKVDDSTGSELELSAASR